MKPFGSSRCAKPCNFRTSKFVLTFVQMRPDGVQMRPDGLQTLSNGLQTLSNGLQMRSAAIQMSPETLKMASDSLQTSTDNLQIAALHLAKPTLGVGKLQVEVTHKPVSLFVESRKDCCATRQTHAHVRNEQIAGSIRRGATVATVRRSLMGNLTHITPQGESDAYNSNESHQHQHVTTEERPVTEVHTAPRFV
jgi:hypothetical protein